MSGKTVLSLCLLVLGMFFFVGNGEMNCASTQINFTGDYSGTGMQDEEGATKETGIYNANISGNNNSLTGTFQGVVVSSDIDHWKASGSASGNELNLENTLQSNDDPEVSYKVQLTGYGLDEDNDTLADTIEFEGHLTTYDGNNIVEEETFFFSVYRN